MGFAMCTKSPLHIARHVLLGIGLVAAFAVVFGWVVMMAWNYVVPSLFGLPMVTFWQAVAVLVLARVLTGRLTHGHHRRFHHHRRHRRGAGGADSAALYSAWWDEEGETAFNAYVARQLGEGGQRG